MARLYFFLKDFKPKEVDFKGICLAALLQCALYILFVGMHMIFSIWGSSEANLSGTLFQGCISDWPGFLTLLLFEMAVLCNLFCAAGGSAIGILLSMLCVIGLIMWLLNRAEVDGVVSEMINPMWLSADIIENGGSYIQKIIIVFLQTAICAVGTGYIWRREIFLQGKEKADDTGSNA